MILVINKRRLAAALLLGLLLVLFLWQGKERGLILAASANSGPLKGKTICLDPGHGGRDPGAVRNSLKEKNLNLDIAKKTAAFLRSQGAHVVMTRTGDYSRARKRLQGSMQRAELYQRSRLSAKAGAQILISIHCNSDTHKNYYGPQTFFEAGDQAGSRLARSIQKELLKVRPAKRSAVAGNYYLLKEVETPAVIVEVGFLSNPEDAKLLASPFYRQRIAEAIGRGVLAYFGR